MNGNLYSHEDLLSEPFSESEKIDNHPGNEEDNQQKEIPNTELNKKRKLTTEVTEHQTKRLTRQTWKKI